MAELLDLDAIIRAFTFGHAGPLCGARRRDGMPCQAPAMARRSDRPLLVGGVSLGIRRPGRCRMHGGTSTGPRTAEGRAAIAASNRRRATVAQGSTRCMGSGPNAAPGGGALPGEAKPKR